MLIIFGMLRRLLLGGGILLLEGSSESLPLLFREGPRPLGARPPLPRLAGAIMQVEYEINRQRYLGQWKKSSGQGS